MVKFKKRKMNPATLSALCALVSLVLFSIIFIKTIPKERPLITLYDNTVKASLEENTINIDLLLFFKNIGQHPAERINIEIASGIKDELNSFKNITNQSIANIIGPDNIFSSDQKMKCATRKSQDGKLIFKERDVIFLIRIKV